MVGSHLPRKVRTDGGSRSIDIDRDRLQAMLDEQAAIGSTGGGGLNRLALSDADARVRDWLVQQFEEMGLAYRIDEMGNIFATRSGTDPDAPPILIGSHLDSQPNGGRFDGALGVVAALEFVRALDDQDIQTHHPIEVVNWTNEEGARFQPALQGSGVWAGVLELSTQYDSTDDEGIRLDEELDRIGYLGDTPARPRTGYEAYLELHIEQGSRLETSGNDVGIVEAIVGVSRGRVTFKGESDHAGTTPMHDRQDALVAASDMVHGIRRIAGTAGEKSLGTVGYANIEENVPNIIPARVTVSWDLRDIETGILRDLRERVVLEAATAADREGVDWSLRDTVSLDPVSFDRKPRVALQAAARRRGYDSIEMIGGAGHDACRVSKICDTGLLFAVSEEGISHSPREYTSPADCYTAADTFANAAFELATES